MIPGPLGFLLGLLLGAAPLVAQDEMPAHFAGDIQVYGSLREMMHDNQTSSQVSLDALPQTEHLFGVGALEGLAGEILILEGRTYLSYPDGDSGARTQLLPETQAPAPGAALLVTAEVPSWDGFVLDAEVPWEQFETSLAQWVERSGWDAQQRLPVQIVATFPALQWHVVDGRRLQNGGSSHEDHLQAASRLQAEDVPARVFGFYSPSDQGVFTHRNSVAHLHVLTGSQQMGHVDGMIVPAGARVLLPSRQEPQAVEWIDAMLEFLGPAAQRQAIRSLTTEAECEGPSGGFKTTMRSIRPDRAYFEQSADGNTTRLVSLPDANWSLIDTGQTTDVDSRLRAFVRGHEFHLIFLDMRQRFSGFRLLGQEERDQHTCRRLAMLDEFGNPATLLLREDDHQPMELVLHPANAQGAVVIEPYVWKELAGVQWFRGFVLTEGPDRVFRYRYTHIVPNTVDATLFERPEAPMPPPEVR